MAGTPQTQPVADVIETVNDDDGVLHRESLVRNDVLASRVRTDELAGK